MEDNITSSTLTHTLLILNKLESQRTPVQFLAPVQAIVQTVRCRAAMAVSVLLVAVAIMNGDRSNDGLGRDPAALHSSLAREDHGSEAGEEDSH